MACLNCNQEPCVCDAIIDVEDEMSRGDGGNVLQLFRFPLLLKIMSWNIERLGDTGPLGHNGGQRADEIIESIARIIHEAFPHIAVLIEVFTGDDGRGNKEVARIVEALDLLGQKHGVTWTWVVTPGATGGLSDPDGNNRTGAEGYALLYRNGTGISCTKGKWLKIYQDFEADYEVTTKGRSYLRDAFQWRIDIDGDGSFLGPGGKSLSFPIVSFHAPGPRADLRRQTQIKDAISNLFAAFMGHNGAPNAFICADFNASEDAGNLLEDVQERDVDYSFPGDLDYLALLVKVVTQTYVVQWWVEKNKNVEDIEWPKKNITFLMDYFKTGDFKEIALGHNPFLLHQLEKIADDAELWFARNKKKFDLTGIAKPKAQAKVMLEEIMTERIKCNLTNEQFELDKARLKMWKTALNARNEKSFLEAYEALEESEGGLALELYAEEDESIDTWTDLREMMRRAFDDEFEDEQEFLGSRMIRTYTDKVVAYTLRQVRELLAEKKNLSIQEGYETAFSMGVDTGFFESTSYDETLKTTRRKSILKSAYPVLNNGKWTCNMNAPFDSVLCSNYDQVLPRTDGLRMDRPSIEVVPVFRCVLPVPDDAPDFRFCYYPGCAHVEQKPRNAHRLFIQLCASATGFYAGNVPDKKQKMTAKERSQAKQKASWDAYREYYDNDASHCCDKQCIPLQDFRRLVLLQTYLSRAKSISDHEPVVLMVFVYAS